MEFEFDTRKSESNKNKHGIDFIAAQALWHDSDRLEIPTITKDEPRIVLIGKIDGKHWTAVFTHRKLNLRLISVRRSRKEEIHLYESA